MLKAIVDGEKRSSGSHLEGGEGTVMVAYERASIDNEVQRVESS